MLTIWVTFDDAEVLFMIILQRPLETPLTTHFRSCNTPLPFKVNFFSGLGFAFTIQVLLYYMKFMLFMLVLLKSSTLIKGGIPSTF